MQTNAKRTIYLSQLEDGDEQERLMQRYHVGFETYQFSIASSLDRLEQSVEEFASRWGQNGPYGLSLHGPFLDLNPAAYDSQIRRVTWERYQQCYQAARALGAQRIVYHSCFCPQIYWEECWEKNSIVFWREFLHDKDDSIQIHMENLYDPSFSPLARVVEAVQHPAFSLCIDVAHINVFSTLSAEQWLEGLRGRVGHFHLSNNDASADCHNALDEGTLDMRRIVERLDQWYPHISCTLEIAAAAQAERSLRLMDAWELR